MKSVLLATCLFAGVLIDAGCTDQEAAKAKQTAEANKAIQHKVYERLTPAISMPSMRYWRPTSSTIIPIPGRNRVWRD